MIGREKKNESSGLFSIGITHAGTHANATATHRQSGRGWRSVPTRWYDGNWIRSLHPVGRFRVVRRETLQEACLGYHRDGAR